jgi:hypothetical protein
LALEIQLNCKKCFWKEKLVGQLFHTWANGTCYINIYNWEEIAIHICKILNVPSSNVHTMEKTTSKKWLLKLYFCKFLVLTIRRRKRKRKGGKKYLVTRHAL